MMNFLFGATTVLSMELILVILICIFGGVDKW